MELLPEWLPNVHPLLVHFPIALLVSAVLMEGLGFLWLRFPWLKQAALALYVVGSLFALGTYFSGRQAADLVTVPDTANPVLNEHADMALYTLLFFSTYTLLRLVFQRTGWLTGRGGSLVLWLIGLVGLGLLSETAEHGGELVYRYGVGIAATGEAVHADTLPSLPGPGQGTAVRQVGPDRWVWQASETALVTLKHDFRWLKADPAQMTPRIQNLPDGTSALQLTLQNQTAAFLLPDTLASIAMEVQVNLDAFRGQFRLIHHIQKGDTYNFVGIDNGKTVLGRRTGGRDRILDTAPLPTRGGWLTLKAVGDGRHFRGYVNGKLLLHGHNSPLAPGPAGLFLSGNGTVVLKQLSVTNLKLETTSSHKEDHDKHEAEHESHSHSH